ncbi:MAG: hypothetical protein ACK4OF_02770 [Aquificaceae bacterium]
MRKKPEGKKSSEENIKGSSVKIPEEAIHIVIDRGTVKVYKEEEAKSMGFEGEREGWLKIVIHRDEKTGKFYLIQGDKMVEIEMPEVEPKKGRKGKSGLK